MNDNDSPVLKGIEGNAPGHSFRVKAKHIDRRVVTRDGDGLRIEFSVPSFKTVVIKFSGNQGADREKKMNRAFVLVPADTSEIFDFGPFHIEGRFEIAEKYNHPTDAALIYKNFEPE